MTSQSLTDVSTHFKFGDNWASYAAAIGDQQIASATQAMLRLIERKDIEGKSFLDIGCGSGLHSLAALSLGASRIMSIDLDPVCVNTTCAVLAKHGEKLSASVSEKSVFALTPLESGQFDLVYSWGVLHHTGDMVLAIKKAADMVLPNGLFVCALYRRTFCDALWRFEKRWYSKASVQAQQRARSVYKKLFHLACLFTGRSFTKYVASYKDRGMDYEHDLHDWMGGYPYETLSAHEFDQLMLKLGFAKERVFARGKELGLFGSGCDEYVYRKKDQASII